MWTADDSYKMPILIFFWKTPQNILIFFLKKKKIETSTTNMLGLQGLKNSSECSNNNTHTCIYAKNNAIECVWSKLLFPDKSFRWMEYPVKYFPYFSTKHVGTH